MIGNILSRRRMLRMLGLTGVGFLSAGFGNRSLFGGSDVTSEPTVNANNSTPEQPPVEFSTTTETFERVTVNVRGEIIERRQGSAEVLSEDLGNGIALEMVYTPGGTFTMGASESGEGSHDYERPQREVAMQPFWMGKYAITQQQWRQVANLPKLQRDLDPDPSYFKGDDRPVEQVNWYDAVEFCARLSVATGTNYILPSEAQWEYACRAGTTTPFYFGATITTDLVNYDGNYRYANAPEGEYREETMPAGSFPPNNFGLYDMHGNVWEWCADSWHNSYAGAPRDGRVWDDEHNDNRYQNYQASLANLFNDESSKIIRGGAWFNTPRSCRSAARFDYHPVIRGSRVGFRVVRSAPRTL